MKLDGLNEIQRQAVTQQKGAMLIVAGAGSGKTRTLTYRIAYLVSKGVSPYSIMALTFTNKAAKEMQQRITDLVGVQAKAILMGTFHSIFSRILRIDGYRIGYAHNYTIYDDYASKKLIGQIVKDLQLDEKMYKKDRILKRISNAKCALFNPNDYENNPEFRSEDMQMKIPETFKIYTLYQRRLRQAMAMDFDDILFNMNVLLRDCSDVLEKYQHRFQYILVDEYQDTNFAQYLIVKKLADYYKNICVVGDDAQSIYSFRGASVQNILSFQKQYPDATIYKLEQNYRSTKNIIGAANSVIIRNEHQIPKKLFTNNVSGDKIHYAMLSSDREEAIWVADKIENYVNEGTHYKDIAILYRTNSQSRSFEDTLRLRNIPYIIYGGTSFYDRWEIKNCTAYLRLVANNDDDDAFERIINYPSRGIGQTTLDRLKIAKETMNTSLFKAAATLEYNNPWKITTKAVNELKKFCLMIEPFTIRAQKEDAYTLGNEIIQRSNIIGDLQLLRDAEDKDRLENVQEFLGALQAFVESDEENLVDALTGEEISIKDKTLEVFLQQISLITSSDKDESNDDDFVKLMTVHAAKGLEFDTVFVAGLEENLFPSAMNVASQMAIEEERRLFYVAVTRAKKHLLLSSANIRYKFGTTTYGERSRFVDEIDKQFLEEENAHNKNIKEIFTSEDLEDFFGKKEKPSFHFKENNYPSNDVSYKKKKPIATLKNNVLNKSSNPLTLTKKEQDKGWREAKIEEICEGIFVKHSKFGIGRVDEVYEQSSDIRAKVSFEGFSEQKVLMLKFAKLKIQTEN